MLKALILLVGISAISASPKTCDQMSIQYEFPDFMNFNIKIFANVAVSLDNNKMNQLSVSGIQATLTDKTPVNRTISVYNICAKGVNTNVTCITDMSKTLSLTTADDFFTMEATFVFSNTSGTVNSNFSLTFFANVVDEGSLSSYDGKLFDENNKCFSYNYGMNLTLCCNSMKNMTNLPAATQPCTHFQSSTTILDANNATYANLTFDYTIDNNNVTMIGKFNGFDGYQPYFVVGTAEPCSEISDKTIYCGYPLSSSGNKLMFTLTEQRDTAPIALTNRLIIRDGQTLMQEGVPFTSSKSCQTFSSPYGAPNFPITTNFCCTQFQASTDTSSPATTTISNDASQSFNIVSTCFIVLISLFSLRFF